MKEALGLLILRIGAGGMMIPHGWSKLSKLISTGEFRFADPIGFGPEITLLFAIFSEFFCAILVLVGFKTRLATIPLIITMLIAALVVHGSDPWSKQEFPLLYAVAYLGIGLLGAGKYSLDNRFGNK